MNLRKNLGRVASTIVATALLASVATVPAFAADTQPVEENTGKILITKNLSKDTDVYAPNATFYFKVDPAEPEKDTDGNVTEKDDNNITVEKGPQDGVKFDRTDGQVTFTPSADTLSSATISAQAKLTFDATKFDHAGVYKYTIQEYIPEGESEYEGVVYDYTEYTMYVYVENGTNGREFANATLFTEDEEGKKTKQETIDNRYGSEDSGKTVKDLVLAKNIEGDAADKTGEFTFDVTVTGTAGEAYNIIYGTVNESGTFTANSGDAAQTEILYSSNTNGEVTKKITVTLGDDEAVKITGLSANDTYNITENEGGQEGYTTTVTGDDTFEANTYTVNGKIVKDSAITYINTRNTVTPTGIVMNAAPYALLVVVAVAGCFVFLRKRNED